MVLNEEHIHRILMEEVNDMAFAPDRYRTLDAFNKINEKCFGNQLQIPQFNFVLPQKYLGYFKFDGKGKGGKLINPILSINGNYQYNINQFESVIAHEMIHYYLAQTGFDTKCTHGPHFKQLAIKINGQFGLNITETIDTGNMQYGGSDSTNGYTPNESALGILRNFYNALHQYNNEMKQDMGNKDSDVLSFMQLLYDFDIALMKALQRCIKKKSLNEINISTVHNAGMAGFRQWSNWFLNSLLSDKRGNRGNGNDKSFQGKESLVDLLFNVYPNKIQKAFNNVNKKTMNFLESIGYIEALIQTIDKLAQYVKDQFEQGQAQNNQTNPNTTNQNVQG